MKPHHEGHSKQSCVGLLNRTLNKLKRHGGALNNYLNQVIVTRERWVLPHGVANTVRGCWLAASFARLRVGRAREGKSRDHTLCKKVSYARIQKGCAR